MDFARPHKHEPSVATISNIRHISLPRKEEQLTLDEFVVESANQAAADLFLKNRGDITTVDSSLFPERTTPQTEIIQANELVVIFESFDNLNFCYAKHGEIFSNRNGHFHHDDFIGKPYGCKIRSRNNQGYGYTYLLKPTPELWARSLKHRTQIVHELDASMIVFYLHLRPNMVVCESGTGSGALSHCIMRTIAPQGHLHTYEFNKVRADTARQEFAKNRVDHLVTVHHKDVCGKQEEGTGGFEMPQASVDAIVLDLPEPWLAVPHAAYCLKPNARVASYSPCVEQSQRTIIALKQAGFHSIKTLEFRLREHYVAEEEYEYVPRDKRPRFTNPHLVGTSTTTETKESSNITDDNGNGTTTSNDDPMFKEQLIGENKTSSTNSTIPVPTTDKKTPQNQNIELSNSTSVNATTESSSSDADADADGGESSPALQAGSKRKSILVARPFGLMRGHTAFLTFATAGNKKRPNPNDESTPPQPQP